MPLYDCRGKDQSGNSVFLEREFPDEASARIAMKTGILDIDSGILIRFKEVSSVAVVDYNQRQIDRRALEQIEIQREAETQKKIETMQGLRSSGHLSIRDTLAPFVECNFGINILNAEKFDGAILTGVQIDHFTAQINDLEISVPYSQIIKIIRSPNGRVNIGAFQGSYHLVVQIFDLVVYKGAVGFGVSTQMPDL